MRIILVLLAISGMGYGAILNWTCDASGGHHILCHANEPGEETHYLNWTDCTYTKPSVYCTTVLDGDKTLKGRYIIITTGAFSDHTYPCAAFNLVEGGLDVIGHLGINGTMTVSLPQNSTDTFAPDHCMSVNSFLWFKKTINCGEQNPWHTTSECDWVHCWQWSWFAWIRGKDKYTCDYARVTPYEID